MPSVGWNPVSFVQEKKSQKWQYTDRKKILCNKIQYLCYKYISWGRLEPIIVYAAPVIVVTSI